MFIRPAIILVLKQRAGQMKTLTKYSAKDLKRTGYVETVWEQGNLAVGISYCVSSNSYSVTWYNNNQPTKSQHRISTLAKAYKIAEESI